MAVVLAAVVDVGVSIPAALTSVISGVEYLARAGLAVAPFVQT